MSEALRKVMQHDKAKQHKKQREERPLSREDKKALRNIQLEARQAGAVLKSAGKGGLPPSFVLGVFRRDKFTCKVHGDKGEGDKGGLEVHHKGGIVESEWLSKKGHKLEPNNVVTLCNKAHDEIHNKARAEGVDSSQVTPEADEGTKRDHGKPVAKPKK